MADTPKKENNNFNLGITDLVIFFGGGAFAAFHKAFLAPSSETSLVDLVVNLFRQSKPSRIDVLTGWIDPVHQVIHAYIHFLISIALQIVLLLWVIKFVIIALKAISVTRKAEKVPGSKPRRHTSASTDDIRYWIAR